MQFRLWKRMGMAVGFLPFSTVGYSLSNTSELTKDEDGTVINKTASYAGDGGLQQSICRCRFQSPRQLVNRCKHLLYIW